MSETPTVAQRIEYAVDSALDRSEMAARGTRLELPLRPAFFIAARVVDWAERACRLGRQS